MRKRTYRRKFCKICGEYYKTDDVTHFLEGCIDDLDAEIISQDYEDEWGGDFDDYDYSN